MIKKIKLSLLLTASLMSVFYTTSFGMQKYDDNDNFFVTPGVLFCPGGCILKGCGTCCYIPFMALCCFDGEADSDNEEVYFGFESSPEECLQNAKKCRNALLLGGKGP